MRVSIVHTVVALLAETDQVPRFEREFRIDLQREDMVDMLRFSQASIPLALLALIFVAAQDGFPDALPF